ncbi:MAG: Zn-ribbon domain-containing OB-fold protein [Acetobacteraceae bacterium]
MSYNKPLPRLDTTNRPFWEGARQGKLLLQYCKACGDIRFPPSHVCPKCLSSDQDWKESSGKGTLESWIDMHRAYWDGYKGELPYRVCLVRLEEGPIMVSNLVDKTDNLRMGQPVRAVFDAVTDEVTLPKFTVE